MAGRFDDFGNTIIHAGDGTIYAGPGAVCVCLPDPATVITAWNPRGERAHPVFNQNANATLCDLLVREGAHPVAVVGQSPDGSWLEESFLVGGLSRARAVAIGIRFEQLAIFELNQEQVLVIDCATGNPRLAVPRVRSEI